MGNIQRVHQQPSRLRALKPKQQGRQPAPRPPVNPVLAFIQTYMLLIFGGISVGLLLLAAWAIMHLVYIPVEKVEPSPTPTPVAAQNSEDEGTLPVGLVGAIALGGIAGGSWLVLQRLKRPRRHRSGQQRLKPRPSSQRAALGQQRPTQFPRPADSDSKTGQRRSAPRRPTNPPIPTMNNRPIPPINVATALPRPTTNEADGGLADRMDMRKRQSLSSILRNR